MNIFVLDQDPIQAAIDMCDKHVIKMILESAQLLCTSHHLLNKQRNIPGFLYRATHINHPCAVWTRTSIDNYKWLSIHAKALIDEYRFRYLKEHASTEIVDWCFHNPIDVLLTELTEFYQAMPDEFKIKSDPIAGYRNYYFNCKRHLIQMKWTIRDKPQWWKDMENANQV